MFSKALQHFRIDRTDGGTVTVWIDVAARSMNVFHDSVIEELDVVVGELERKVRGYHLRHRKRAEMLPGSPAAPRAVVFRSAKASGFFAGADVKQIAGLQTPEEVHAVISRGQELFARIERLAVPTIAAIHGPCLGGGLEFALACDHRIAMNTRATRLGLPEVQLGLIPGWGGTQRLPKLVGLPAALPLILQGKKLTAVAASKIGLVDAVYDELSWDEYVHAYVGETCFNVSSSGRSNVGIRTQRTQNRKNRLLRAATDSRLGRWLVLRMAAKKIRRTAKDYPALLAAIRSVQAAFNKHVDGFAVERNEFATLIESSTCRNLLNLFLRRERARSLSTHSRNEHSSAISPAYPEAHNTPDDREGSPVSATNADAPAVRTIGIVGAGAMGAGIGQLAALHGFDVILKELTPELASTGLGRVSRLLDDMVAKRRLSLSDRDEILSRVSVTDNFPALADCDLVIEAIVEEMDAKRAVFASLDAALKPDAVILSNTSALSITEMAKATARADRVAGLHFFNPVHRMELVEVVRTDETSEETVTTLLKLAKKLGKTAVVTTDSPGFLVNRALFPYIGEAVRMVLEGYDCRKLDSEVKRFGMPMGPIDLIDHVGIDVAWHVAGTLEDVLPESKNVIRLLGQMVARGWTGRKGGRGFYVYQDGKSMAVNPELPAFIRNDRAKDVRGGDSGIPVGAYLSDGLTDVQRRLIYPMINEVGFCMQEEVVTESWMADLAMVLGTGFAPFRGGPMTLAESIGHPTLLNNLHVLTARHGERFKPSAWLVNTKTESQTPDAVLRIPSLL
ncbi:MAG: multifunctional fatty acid oxidation complex subunit alpha [Fuerstiella sp.]|nr:multifunctional fatty acid oxidation complex subunit alpha [Fuerstiella sp.]MCP4857425.1 multifunctional fatty acid oxidation complex subunit alpha [Fuerstiella sp.]